MSAYLLFFANGGIVNIIVGVPPAQLKYKAISHVWGNSEEAMYMYKLMRRATKRRTPVSRGFKGRIIKGLHCK
jgi:hypothetical protein